MYSWKLHIFFRSMCANPLYCRLSSGCCSGRRHPSCSCVTKTTWMCGMEIWNKNSSHISSMTQSSLEVLGKKISFFMCSDALFAQTIRWSVWRVNWNFRALHWLFLCFGLLETWKRSRTPGPESDDCELAPESSCTLWADIFNSRYFLSANFDCDLWQNKGILDAKDRIQVFPRWFSCHFWIFVVEWVT